MQGGRGKGGGVRVAHYPYEVATAAEEILGKRLVTPQTGKDGVSVNQVLIEQGVEIDREYYLSMIIDRSTAKPTMIFSPAGGMEIEEVARKSPELILKQHVDPAAGWMPYQGRNLVYKLDPPLNPAPAKQLMGVMADIYRLFVTLDCSLVEINPLAVTKEGKVMALDAKITIDDNALFRQKELIQLDDPREKDPLESTAEKYRLNYIRLDGKYRSHGKRRRISHGHHGRNQAGRGGAGQFPRCGRRRQRRDDNQRG